MPGELLANLAGSDLGHPETNPAERAAELCAARVWEAVEGGYRVLDAEAGVRACKPSDPRTMRWQWILSFSSVLYKHANLRVYLFWKRYVVDREMCRIKEECPKP